MALREAEQLGCSGAHFHKGSGWMACSNHEEYMRLERRHGKKGLSIIEMERNIEKRNSRRKKRPKKQWENLTESGVISIDTLAGGGLVSGAITKSAWAPIDGDSDVFTDIATARRRARQLGCIGVARRTSRGGNTVWTPCTNMTDYQKRTGSTAFGARRREERELQILRQRIRKIYRGGKSLAEELGAKSLGGSIRRGIRFAETYDPNAVDGDNDGVIQDGTAFQRPAVVNDVKKNLVDFLSSNPGYLDDFGDDVRSLAGPNVARGFASATRSGRTIAIGAGGRQMGEKILNRVGDSFKNKKGQRRFHFVGGTPGAGKSTLVKNGTFYLPPMNEAAHIDPDEIKTGLVGYDGGKGAQAVHTASRIATDKIMQDANAQEMDMVVQGIGKRTEHLKWAKRWGMETVGHFAWVPDAEADKRIAARRRAGGTNLPDGYGSHMSGYIRAEVPRQITSNLYDEFYLWDNSGPQPRLVASRARDGKFEIFDDQVFDDFFGKTGAGYVRRHWQNQ